MSPSKLFTAAAMLKTRLANQKELTAAIVLLNSLVRMVLLYENWRVVAVTLPPPVQ